MNISIESDGGPVYRQIVEQIRSLIVRGELSPGTSLPSVRNLAKRIGVSSLTVHHAYKRLNSLGLIESRPRSASRVALRISGSAGRALLGRVSQSGPVANFEMIAESGGVRSMASSVGDPRLFYPEELLSQIDRLRHDGPHAFYYTESAGAPELLHEIARDLCHQGLDTSESDLVVTTGSTRGLSLLFSVLTEPGDTVLVQEPGRLLLADQLRANRLVGIPIPLLGASIDLEFVARSIAQYRPRVMVLSPDFGHATGLSMSEDDRSECTRIARDSGMVIIEDAAMSPLRLGATRRPPIVFLDPEISAYVGSLSYSLCPGLRVGFVRARPALRAAVCAASQTSSVSGCGFVQVALARYMASGAYEAHLKRVLPRYCARRDALMASLTTTMPRWVNWTEPVGGLSTWLTLKPGASSSELYNAALKQGIAFAHGRLFMTSGDPERHLRLSYGVLEPEAIWQVVGELGALIGRLTR